MKIINELPSFEPLKVKVNIAEKNVSGSHFSPAEY
jgi:hypothetical protein